jgi:hypothetical protein
VGVISAWIANYDQLMVMPMSPGTPPGKSMI